MSESMEHFAGEVEKVGSGAHSEYLGAHLRDVFLLALHLVGTRAEAQELTQDAFITVLQRYRGTQDQAVISAAVRETAIGFAIQSIRRTAIQSARTAGKAQRGQKVRDSDHEGGLHPSLADPHWGERVLVLLHEAEALPLSKIAVLLQGSLADARTALARVRIAEVADQEVFEHSLPQPHPAVEDLALFVSRDGPLVSELRARWHVRGCPVCAARCAALKKAEVKTRQAARQELRALEGLVDWLPLEREISGNIAVGIAAARCIDHVRKRRSLSWKATVLALGVSALLAAGWMTHIPAEQSARLLATLQQAFRGGIHQGVIVAGSAPGVIFIANSLNERVAMVQPAGAAVQVDGLGGVSTTFFDPETGVSMRESVSRPTETESQTSSRPAVASAFAGEPTFHVSVPAGSPVAIENLEFGREGSADVHVAMMLRNIGERRIAAVAFRIESRVSGHSMFSSVAAEGLTAETGERVPIGATLRLPADNRSSVVNLALDCVLFADLTSYGPDREGTRLLLTANEVASQRERTFLRQSIAGGNLAGVRRELDFGLDPTPQSATYDVVDLSRPPTAADRSSSGIQFQSMKLDGSPVLVRPGPSASDSFAVTARNVSAHLISWMEIGVAEIDERGQLALAIDLPLKVRLRPDETAGASMLDRLRLRRHFSHALAGTEFLYVRAVQFEDGTWWEPDVQRAGARDFAPAVLNLVDASPARTRLAALFRRAGMGAVEQELGGHGAN
jgi:RNA polymerase sigma-70 factor (ECF subfamily)